MLASALAAIALTAISCSQPASRDSDLNPNEAPYSLTLTMLGEGRGEVRIVPPDVVCRTDCLQTFSSPVDVTLTVTVESASAIGSWGGACSSAGTTRQCMLRVDRPVAAALELTAAPQDDDESATPEPDKPESDNDEDEAEEDRSEKDDRDEKERDDNGKDERENDKGNDKDNDGNGKGNDKDNDGNGKGNDKDNDGNGNGNDKDNDGNGKGNDKDDDGNGKGNDKDDDEEDEENDDDGGSSEDGGDALPVQPIEADLSLL